MTIKQLTEKYNSNHLEYSDSKYNEMQLRNDFLDPFFEILGWDIKNIEGKSTNEREVILEESLKEEAETNAKKPDYTFRLFSERKYFVEAKKPSVQIGSNPEFAKQIRRYGFTAKLKISVLANFENMLIYDCSLPVEETDNHHKALIRQYFHTSSGLDNLYTYRLFKPNSIVIYPYRKVDNKIVFVNLKELKKDYPFLSKYLKHYKSKLTDPKRDIKPNPETRNEWYRYGRHQALDSCDVPEKIVVGVLSQGNKYAIDRYQTLISSGGTAGYCMIVLPNDSPYSIYYIQAILNSKYVEWYSALIGEVFRGGYIARGTKVLKKIPIRNIDFSNKKDKSLHKEIVVLQKKLINIQSRIDKASKNPRARKLADIDFKREQNKMNLLLSKLYSLGDDDMKIPLIKDIYAAN